MKYAFVENDRITSGPVEIPQPLPSWAATPAEFLKKMLDVTGWVQVPDSAVSGAVDNHDGTFTNPVEVPHPSSGDADYNAALKARANELIKSGDILGALALLLPTLGD